MGSTLAKELEHHGIVVLPGLVSADKLGAMRAAFERRLRRFRWNDVDGYEMTELHRHMVQDVLTVHQGFVDLALHPQVKEALGEYLGRRYELVEAKGWLSVPTRRDFHGWHGDAWYDQSKVEGIPREVKLAVYLTDVRSGAFNYVRGSHAQQAPRLLSNAEVQVVDRERILEVTGPAGTAFLFDTSGVHRQSVPILEPRQAVFYNYHDPSVPLQTEDVKYYRYHPLLLNAAFLGGLSEEDRAILGFGNKDNYQEGFEREAKYPYFEGALRRLFAARVWAGDFGERLAARWRRLMGRRGG